MNCSVQACAKSAWARGLCHAHLQKLYMHGDPLAGGTRAPNGSGYIDAQGYKRRRANGAEKPEAVHVAERVLGKALPQSAVVHHVDTDRLNNANTNLVVCPNAAYHNLLHQRMRALDACGNANWRKCCRCKVYDALENLRVSGSHAYHPACNRAHVQKYKGIAA